MTKPVREKNNFLVFGSPRIEEAEINEVVDSLKSGWLGTGPKVARFEDLFRTYKSAEHAAALNSCTAALHVSLLASGVGPGDEVIAPALTFCATINAIIHSGATPVLADIDPDTLNIDPQKVEAGITAKTKALLPVHFAGRPCNMNALLKIAGKHKLKLIEDCAHAIESEYHGQKTGTFGDFGCFSFYVTKNITTGEGGMVITRAAKDEERIKMLALHGMSRDAWRRFSDSGYNHYFVRECGFKYNMMDLQAALGIHQLKRIDECWQKREKLWNYYNQELADLPLVLPTSPEPDTKHAYHLYQIMITAENTRIKRDDFLKAITKENIGVGVHYLSLAEHPYYQQTYGWRPEDYPQALRVGRQTVSLPLSAKLVKEDADDVIAAIRKVLKK